MNSFLDKNICQFFSEDEKKMAELYATRIEGTYIGNLIVDKLKEKYSVEECLDILKKVLNTYYEFGGQKTKQLINYTLQTYK